MNINWEQGNNWIPVQTDNVKADYGGLHVYALTMTLGMLIAIFYSLYKFKKHGMPLNALLIAAICIVPASLFGASFFGKLNADGPGINADGTNFWGLFAFWHAGMAIHGGVYVGMFVGFTVLGIVGRKTKISVWAYADAIVPNILLGQAIGRWGNFFNHEVMGAPIHTYGNIGSSFSTNSVDGFVRFSDININTSWHGIHLPDWMLQNTMAVCKTDTLINGVQYHAGDVVQMSPIFFIESMALLVAWVLITFIIPGIFKLISKKPWKVNPQIDFSIKYTFTAIFNKNKLKENQMSWYQAWKWAYTQPISQEIKDKYYADILTIDKSNKWKIKKQLEKGKALVKANNPNGYLMQKSGFETCAYLFAWNIVRFFLELSRPDDHLFIMFNKPLSLGLIMATAIVGILGMITTQTIIPWFFRKPGNLYELDYFE